MVLGSSQTAAYRSITTSIALQGRWTPARPSAPVVLIIAKISPQGPNQTNPTPPSELQGPDWSDHMLTVPPSVPYRSRTRERGCVQIGRSLASSPGFFLRSRFRSTAACLLVATNLPFSSYEEVLALRGFGWAKGMQGLPSNARMYLYRTCRST